MIEMFWRIVGLLTVWNVIGSWLILGCIGFAIGIVSDWKFYRLKPVWHELWFILVGPIALVFAIRTMVWRFRVR